MRFTPPYRTQFRIGAALLTAVLSASARADVPQGLTDAIEQIEKAAAAHDPAALAAMYDAEEIAKRTVEPVAIEERMKARFIKNLGAQMPKSTPSETIRAMGDVGSYKHLTIRNEGDYRVVFRLQGLGGLSYHELRMTNASGGTYKVIDVYTFDRGELLTEALRRGVQIVAAENGTPGTPGAREVEALHMLVAQEKYADVLALWPRLPEPAKSGKPAMLCRIQAAANTDADTHQKAMDDYYRLYENDIGGYLVSISPLYAHRQFDEALDAIRRVDKVVGGDAYLDVYRGSIELARGDAAAAKSRSTRALVREPNLFAAMDGVLTVSLATGDFAGARTIMLRMENDTPFRFGDLGKSPAFADFMKSEDYAKWLKERPAK